AGFQHLVQPQRWSWRTWPLILTRTVRLLQAQASVPPAKPALSLGIPLSIAGCSVSGIFVFPPLSVIDAVGPLSAACRSVKHDAADTLASVHEIKTLVDVLELQRVGDHRVDLDLAVHVPVDDLRHVGAAARAAEGGAHPASPGDKLERSRRDFLASTGNADDHRLAPTAMRAFERLAHDLGVAGAVESVVGAADLVGAALGHVDEMGDHVAVDLLGIDEMRHPELF